jgi:hypothetical protein
VAGALLGADNTWAAWRAVFWVAGAVYTLGALPYMLLIQAEPQPWNDLETSKEAKEQPAEEDI